ncbi:uncharacterized protein CcaverHIS019_0107730 [Cutaneotrichosporon cavernicola]|uniref:Uncharacterized protein n=1 Tax=Cutaneotrichosporon cavernicola TaxID=279322 RepID=A0AA48L0D0_9TREE|nr:uncharacterized protein CcaverHIS019_0107730 [Cutaneotrichosporon cavernicola]BEI88055.1 hypothetical protein CcaverHIS019_0107730 [Cutaneotrichosporon cavernicola]BEI95826.1 hypothetical protein CcaverHIS631_0107750 [Cutaneotrichosporon cavernicola]BEJ03600.1 hypothetical protein CcaverHIS641_0107750 [Cutaneotrichosporon cavernicola]
MSAPQPPHHHTHAGETLRHLPGLVPTQRRAPPRIPEKCLSWCSQRDGAPAMCRMLCLRNRTPLLTQAEALAKLRPDSSSSKTASIGDFFEAWRTRLSPYSFIYVKGTPEGVVGRYMEELDADDGQYDFGAVSRWAPDKMRRRSDGVEYLDWGEAGCLLHVPFTSIFSPFLNLPRNVERVMSPPINLATQYYESFENGTQARALGRFTDEVYKLGAFDMVSKVIEHWRDRAAKQAEAEAAAQKEADRGAESAQAAREARDRVKEKNTKE